MQTFNQGFWIVGSTKEKRRIVDASAALRAYADIDDRIDPSLETYFSAFQFNQEFADFVKESGGSTAGYQGQCWSPWLWFDIDASADLERARRDTALLAYYLTDKYGIGDDNLLLFFSGSKGFHLGVPTSAWAPEPCVDFHRIARLFCENHAAAAKVTIDAGIYDRVRAFRAPNTRHPKTGHYKRRVSLNELTHLDIAAIKNLATEPSSFEIPDPADHCPNAAAAWKLAAEQARSAAAGNAVRRFANLERPSINRATMAVIRGQLCEGDRHRMLFSAAANFSEFACPPTLAHALLTEAGLDSGLSPSEVRRQIDCGLSHGRVAAPSNSACTPMPSELTKSGCSKAERDSQLARLWARAATNSSTVGPQEPAPTFDDGQQQPRTQST